MLFQSEKLRCHFSLQRSLASWNMLLYKTIRTNSFNNFKSSHKHTIFYFKLGRSLSQKCIFNVTYCSKEERKDKLQHRLLLTFTSLPPYYLSTLHCPPACILWLARLWGCVGYISPEHSHHSVSVSTTNSFPSGTGVQHCELRGCTRILERKSLYAECVGMNSSKTLSIHLDNLIKVQWT